MRINEDLYHLAKQLAREEYERNLGKIILVHCCVAYQDYDTVDLIFNPPLRAVVERTDLDSDIYRVCDDWMDPIWNIRPLEERVPENCSSFFVHATSWPLSDKATEAQQETGNFTPTYEKEPLPTFVDFTLI